MKHLLLIIIILLIIPYHSFSNEYIIIKVCKAISGCPLNLDTGECPTCVNEKRKIKKVKVKNNSLMIRKDLYVRLQKKIMIMNDRSLFDCELCIGYKEKWRQ